MMNRRLFLTLLVSIAALVLTSAACHAESRVPCRTVPAAVLAAAKTEAPDATVRGCVKDKENGKLTYEVETLQNGKSKDMIFDPSGKLIEIEQEIDRDRLPPAVASAIAKAAGDGNIGKVESVTRGGAIASYETTITRKGKRREVAFSPEGAAMKAD